MFIFLNINLLNNLSNYIHQTAYELINHNFFVSILQPIVDILYVGLFYVNQITHDYGWAIVIFTIILKLILYPLTEKQFVSMKQMQELQPEVKRLQDKYKNDPQKLNAEIMKLYQEKGINPAAGCLPTLIQLPILYAMYILIMQNSVLFAGNSFLWIKDISKPDMPLLILYALSMILTSKIGMQDNQTNNAFMTYGFPILIAYIIKHFASAFVLYWFVFNLVSIIHQYLIFKNFSKSKEMILDKK